MVASELVSKGSSEFRFNQYTSQPGLKSIASQMSAFPNNNLNGNVYVPNILFAVPNCALIVRFLG
jgi:hypothetical protein